MPKLYLFCIGGTGCRVLRSFTMMMAAGVDINVDEIVPIIIDPDTANADRTRAISLLQTYNAIRSKLSFSEEIPTRFFRKEISQAMPDYSLRIQGTVNKTFQQFIDLSSMDNPTQAFVRMLFSEKNLSSNMDVGFKGNPNMGSVVLNQIVASEDFEAFANNFSEEDKIFIISSIFGGTGASGFPLLLNTLRTGGNFPNFNIINNAEIGAITILPYFKLKSDEESEIDSSTFISKTKSALAYYEKNIYQNGFINALYYLADDMANTYANHEGGSAQRNNAHLIEFLAATAIVDFCAKQYAIPTNKELGLKDLADGVVTFSSFYSQQRNLLFAPLTMFTMVANLITNKMTYYSSSQFNANYENFKDFYNGTFMADLQSIAQKYLEWLQEMKDNKRSLSLFNVNTGDKPFDVVTDIKPKKIRSIKSNYDLVTARLNSAVKKCKSKQDEDKFLEMLYLGFSRLVKEKLTEN